MFPEVEVDRKTVIEYQLLVRYHEVQETIDRTTDPEEIRKLEERKKEINEQFTANR